MTPEDREKIINEYNNIKNSNPLKKLSVKKYYDSLNNEKKMTFSYRTIQNWKHDLNINESKNIKKRIRFSKNIKMEISRKYWVEKDKYSTVNDFIENNYNIYSNSSIKNIIYTQEYKPLNELQEFKSYIYNGISTNEINNTIQSKELYKCLDLKVVEVPGLRFGVVADKFIEADKQPYLCVYSNVIKSNVNSEQSVYSFGSANLRSGNGKYCIVADNNDTGFGPFMNDALDKYNNNCGLVFLNLNGSEVGVVISIRDICVGEQCCIEYGKDYWEFYLSQYILDETLAKKIKSYYNIN
jgi:hypothetical protein